MRIMNAVKRAASEGAGDLVLRSGTVPMWRLPASGLGPMPEEREVHTGGIEQLAILLSGQITIGLEALRGNDMDFRAYVAGAAWRCNLSSCSPRDGAVADVTDRPDLHAGSDSRLVFDVTAFVESSADAGGFRPYGGIVTLTIQSEKN